MKILSSIEIAGPSPTVMSRLNRYSRVTLDSIRVHRAQSEADLATVARLRQQGFSRIPGSALSRGWLDDSDYQLDTFSLLAIARDGNPIGTMRVQDGRNRSLELMARVPLDQLLHAEHVPAAQFARLSVIKHPDSLNAMFGIFKAAWRWCLENQLRSIVIATPPWAKPIYEFMCFDDLPADGRFTHELAGGAEHSTMRLDVQLAEKIWRSQLQPLCGVFFDTLHPLISAN